MLNVAILGAGPGGTGPLICAAKTGLLPKLLDTGVGLFDKGAQPGAGSIGKYAINSDTVGGTFLECLADQGAEYLPDAMNSPANNEITARHDQAIPLAQVGEFLNDLGRSIQAALANHPVSYFAAHTTAQRINLRSDGGFDVQSELAGVVRTVRTRRVVQALGGAQNTERTLGASIAPGIRAIDYGAKVMLTDQLLTQAGLQRAAKMLPKTGAKVVIIGSSHSAFSATWALLNRLPEHEFSQHSIQLLCRTWPKVFYPNQDAARQDGYHDFTDQDICPVTGRVFRLAGLRLDSRMLLRRILGLVPDDVEQRVVLRPLTNDRKEAEKLAQVFAAADLIIPAFGYEPRTLPVYDPTGKLIELAKPADSPLVNQKCEVLTAAKEPIPGLYGLGLASGYQLPTELGGEPSFVGQSNGLWLYQHGIGQSILDQLW